LLPTLFEAGVAGGAMPLMVPLPVPMLELEEVPMVELDEVPMPLDELPEPMVGELMDEDDEEELVSGVGVVVAGVLLLEGDVVVELSSFLPQAPRANRADSAITVAAGFILNAVMSDFLMVRDGGWVPASFKSRTRGAPKS
jgi:hypothetical protein